jgi:hypothetical protein
MASDEFLRIFDELRGILQPFEQRLALKTDTPDHYSLDAPFSEKWKRELFFGSAQIKKGYVSFHLFPVYMFPDLLEQAPASLKKRMQGKSCFNFKRLEPELFQELATLTKSGFARMQAEGLA